MIHTVNRKRLVRTFTDLVKISSPSWKEQGVIDYISAKLRLLGISFEKYPCGESFNLVARLQGNVHGTPILFAAHMDTVTPCEAVNPIVFPNKITSDGTSILGGDDKSAVAIFLEGLQILKESGAEHGSLEIAFTCAEEIGLKGAKCLDIKKLNARYAFVYDSGGPVGKIILQAPFHSTMEVTIRGKAAHAGMEPEKGLNAIRVLSEIIMKLPSGRIDRETTLNVGIISGGRATNIVPELASCLLEIRSQNRGTLASQEKSVKKTVREIAALRGARSRIFSHLEYSGFRINQSDPIVRMAKQAFAKIGIKPAFEVSGGGSDTNVFNKAGIMAINLSCGMRKVHTTKEFILIKDLIQGARFMLALIETART